MALFDERLKLALKEKKISQAELCKITEIPKSAMSQYVSGKFIPRQNRINMIAEVLGVDAAWLLGLESSSDLSDDERELIALYRSDEDFKSAVNELMCGRTVFRAAKSEDGSIAPTNEKMSGEQLEKIAAAPDTDQDF